MDLAFQQLQGLWQRPLAAARRAPHLTDGYGVVIALTANECAICATSRRWAGRRFRSFDGPDSQRTSLSRLSGRNGARAITTCSPTVPWSAAS
jgi:hypothetical protein